MIAFRGATALEAQVGRAWIRVLLPRLWCRGNLRRLVQVGWETAP